MMKQILLLSLILVLSQQQTDFSFTPGNMWYIKYGNAQAADGTNANNFEEGYKDNLPVDETYGDVSWYTFLKNWGSDKTKCAEITGDGTAASAYASDGTATTWQLTTPDTDTTKDVEYDTLISSDNSFCLRMTQEYNTFSAFALRPIPLDAIKCYEDTKDFSPLSDAGNNYKGCFATAIKPIADKWVWLESKFKFSHDNFDVAAIDEAAYTAKDGGNPFRVGTVGGYVQCVKRNGCYSKLSDHMTSRSNYPENDIWWWNYHASIVAKFDAEECSSLNLGSDAKASMHDDTNKFSENLIKCLNTFKKDLLATDREAVQCLEECAQQGKTFPDSYFKVGSIDGEADDDDLKEFQTNKKNAIDGLLKCVNDKNIYNYEVHPRVVAKDEHATYPVPDLAQDGSISDAWGLQLLYNWAQNDQQVRTCYRISQKCTEMQWFIQWGYQYSDNSDKIYDCINQCSPKPVANFILPFEQAIPNSDVSGHVSITQYDRNNVQSNKVKQCYLKFKRSWELALLKYYSD